MPNGKGETIPTPGPQWTDRCALLLIDHDGTITFASRVAASFLNISVDEVAKRPFSSLWGGASDVKDFFHRALSGETVLNREVRADSLHGGKARMHMNFVPFRDAETIRGIACLFTVSVEGEPFFPAPSEVGVAAIVLKDGRAVFASPSAVDLTGYSLEELFRRDFSDLVHPQDRENLFKALQGCVPGQDLPSRSSFRIQTLHNEIRWLEAAFSPWTWEGRPAAAVVAFDVTQDKERETAFEVLFESVEETIACDELVLDARGDPVDWIIREVNTAYERTFCLDRSEVVGRKASSVYGEEIVRSFLPAFSLAVAEQRSVRFDFYLREVDRYFIVSAFPMGGLRFGTIGLDVSEHRRAEKERERLLAELDATINAIAEAVVIYGRRGEILRMNPVAKEFLHYGAEEGERPLYERLARLRVSHPNGSPYPLRETFDKVFRGETVRGELLIFHAPDGRQQWISASAAPVYAADGRLIGAVGTAADVSRVRQLQEEREVYLHTISHDLRTPLTVIEGHAQLLQSRRNDPDFDAGESIDAILKGAQGMTDMIDTLVDTAYLESGQLQLRREEVFIPSFLEDFLHRAEMALNLERIELDAPPDVPSVQADPLRLERILSNLLSNALKYSYENTLIQVKVTMEQESMRISVRDRGPGIDPEDLPHIFERFYQTKRGRKGKGIGLGLYISRLLTEAHGGRIIVESEPGEGSTFSFTLPLE